MSPEFLRMENTCTIARICIPEVILNTTKILTVRSMLFSDMTFRPEKPKQLQVDQEEQQDRKFLEMVINLAFVKRVRAKSVLFIHDLETGEEWPIYDS